MRKDNKWNAIKILIENHFSEGIQKRYIPTMVAKEMALTRQAIYYYIKKNNFKYVQKINN